MILQVKEGAVFGFSGGLFYGIEILWDGFITVKINHLGRRFLVTPLKFNMEPESQPLEKEIPFGNHHFQIPC